MSSSNKVLFGFHAVGVRIKTAPKSVFEVFFDVSRRDARMRQFTDGMKAKKNFVGRIHLLIISGGFLETTTRWPPPAQPQS